MALLLVLKKLVGQQKQFQSHVGRGKASRWRLLPLNDEDDEAGDSEARDGEAGDSDAGDSDAGEPAQVPKPRGKPGPKAGTKRKQTGTDITSPRKLRKRA